MDGAAGIEDCSQGGHVVLLVPEEILYASAEHLHVLAGFVGESKDHFLQTAKGTQLSPLLFWLFVGGFVLGTMAVD